jgi:glycosyltransferase involved in cell wall biosynthesis
MKIALLMITIDRHKMTMEVLRHNLQGAGCPVHLFVSDNGSSQPVLDSIEQEFADVLEYSHRYNANVGVAGAFNDMLHEAYERGFDFFILMGNDIFNDPGWAKAMADTWFGVVNSGLVALDWGCGANPKIPKQIAGHDLMVCSGVFGVTGFGRHILDTVGYFCTDYWPYGFEDGDLNTRVQIAGFVSYYLTTHKSKHAGADVGQKTPYRKIKDDAMSRNGAQYLHNLEFYKSSGKYFLPYISNPYFSN